MMLKSKKIVIATSLLILVLIVGGYIYQRYFLKKPYPLTVLHQLDDSIINNIEKLISDEPENQPYSASLSAQLAGEPVEVFIDESGFVFDHPESIDVIKNYNMTDDLTYSEITFSSDESLNEAFFKITDTKASDINDWLKQFESKAKVSDVKNIKLGSMQGKQFISNDKVVFGVIDQEILFYAEFPKFQQNDIWDRTYKTFLASFSFSDPEVVETSEN